MGGTKCPVACGNCNEPIRVPDPEGCMDSPPGWVDSDGNGCDFYASNPSNCEIGNSFPNQGLTANDVCCACGGGCNDLPGWYDSGGVSFGCKWYKEGTGNRCGEFGRSFRNQHYVADEACCVCGGGNVDQRSRYLMSNKKMLRRRRQRIRANHQIDA